MKNINLQKVLLYATGQNLQIGKGMGLSIDDPIVVTENHHGFAVETERFAAKEISILYGWWQPELGKISLLEHENRNIEEFTINCLDDKESTVQKKLYFDITDGYKNIQRMLEQVKTAEELILIKDGTYYSDQDALSRFYGAFTYARTLRSDERLDVPSLAHVLNIEAEHAHQLLKALKECGFEIDEST